MGYSHTFRVRWVEGCEAGEWGEDLCGGCLLQRVRAAGSAGVTLQTGLNSGIQRHLLGGLGVKQTRAEGPAQLPSIHGDRLFLQPPPQSLFGHPSHAVFGQTTSFHRRNRPFGSSCTCRAWTRAEKQDVLHAETQPPSHALPTAPAHVICSDRPCVSASVRRASARVMSTSQRMACW